MQITPENQAHEKLEQDAKDFLSELGFLTDEATYHTVMNLEVKDRLSRIYTPTSLYLRGRADRIAVHKSLPLVFEWEAKTHESRNLHDMLLEALPLCHHLIKAQLDVECLYVYRNPHKNHEAGFWIKDIPTVRIIMIPSRWSGDQISWFTGQFKRFFPETDIRSTGSNAGSGDPFLIIDESTVTRLPHWKDCIRGRLS